MTDNDNQKPLVNQYRRKTLFSAAALSVVYFSSAPSLASGDGGGDGGGGDGGGEPGSSGTVPARTGATAAKVSNATTASVVKGLNACRRFCGKLPQKEYVIDCLSERLRNVAKTLPSTGDYAEAKVALEEASRKLHNLARKNASRKLPPVRMQVKGTKTIVTSRPLIAVKTSTLKQVNQQAIAIVQEAETVLLRATENSERRKVHYQRIATAVGSNKVLLRSS